MLKLKNIQQKLQKLTLDIKCSKSYQQNSNLQGGVHVICMQPWFFSIGRLHFGQGFELANILKYVITSSKKY